MRGIHLSNEKKRDSVVGFEGKVNKAKIHYVLSDNSHRQTIKVLESTDQTNLDGLLKKVGKLENISDSLINGDPEVDLFKSGMIVDELKKVYLNKDGHIAYSVKIEEINKSKDGLELSRHAASQVLANINTAIPISWTGKILPKEKAVKMFVFARKYQINHLDGLTYDFLYDMAKTLEEKNGLLLLGAGEKGSESLIFTAGGTPYKGFLEGRTEGNAYLLILHLTNLELKEFTTEVK